MIVIGANKGRTAENSVAPWEQARGSRTGLHSNFSSNGPQHVHSELEPDGRGLDISMRNDGRDSSHASYRE